MGENSKIEWTDHTFNPWIGCAKVAPGCTHCYAESMAKRTGKAKWGAEGTRVKTSEKYWQQPLKWNAAAAQAGVRARVFCASMADVFEDWKGEIATHDTDLLMTCMQCGFVGRWPLIPARGMCCPSCDQSHTDRPAMMNDLRGELFRLIDETQNLDWLLLTKRPENIRRMWPAGMAPVIVDRGLYRVCSLHRENVWLGTSISDQATANANVPALLDCYDLCGELFLSAEPLLGPIDLRHIPGAQAYDCNAIGRTGVDWVIVGGESGHGGRPMHPDWARSLRDQCQVAAVPFFFKQWGEWAPWEPRHPAQVIYLAHDGSQHDRPIDAGCRSQPMVRVGKKAAGRRLSGVEWNEFPASPALTGSSPLLPIGGAQ